MTTQQTLSPAQYKHWFGDPCATKDEAQGRHDNGILSFYPAAVFRTPTDEYVLGYLSQGINFTPQALQDTADNIKRLIGFEMVSTCDPLLAVWKDWA